MNLFAKIAMSASLMTLTASLAVAAQEQSSSASAESEAAGQPIDEERLYDAAIEGLRAAGVLTASDRIVCRATFHIDPAYVIYDEHRRRVLPRIHEALARCGIRSIGRYGGWYYNSMEDSLADGRALAMELLAQREGLPDREKAGREGAA